MIILSLVHFVVLSKENKNEINLFPPKITLLCSEQPVRNQAKAQTDNEGNTIRFHPLLEEEESKIEYTAINHRKLSRFLQMKVACENSFQVYGFNYYINEWKTGLRNLHNCYTSHLESQPFFSATIP